MTGRRLCKKNHKKLDLVVELVADPTKKYSTTRKNTPNQEKLLQLLIKYAFLFLEFCYSSQQFFFWSFCASSDCFGWTTAIMEIIPTRLIGPLNKRPSTKKIHHFVQNKEEKRRKNTHDMWHMICDMWHVVSWFWFGNEGDLNIQRKRAR